jgi:hypothetical protein
MIPPRGSVPNLSTKMSVWPQEFGDRLDHRGSKITVPLRRVKEIRGGEKRPPPNAAD